MDIKQFQPPPVCGSECQREKLLAGLKTTLDGKEITRDQDPAGYQKARIDYYTALNGQGWLATEKERIAKQEIDPKITSYTQEYNQLTEQDKSQKKLVDAMSVMRAQEVSGDEQLEYLQDMINEDTVNKNILNRLTELNYLSPPPSNTVVTQSSNVILTILKIVMGLLAVYVIYMIYVKFIGNTIQPVTVGGKRVPH